MLSTKLKIPIDHSIKKNEIKQHSRNIINININVTNKYLKEIYFHERF